MTDVADHLTASRALAASAPKAAGYAVTAALALVVFLFAIILLPGR